jgi:choline dehydrogenase-like flavoprotein
MPVERLSTLPDGTTLEADLVIVGAGACGLTLAGEMSGHGLDILLLESGDREETPAFEALNAVEVESDTWNASTRALRATYHSVLTQHWTAETQQFGVRCRGLGGSTIAWAGKSAPFDEVDFQPRDWVPHSGWPVGYADLMPFVDRAAKVLNLGPHANGNRLWADAGQTAPDRGIPTDLLRPFYWQFARGRVDATDVMRLGAEFLAADPADIRVLTNATVTRVLTDPQGGRFQGLDVADLDGRRIHVRARACVLAASAIENARLLLVSDDVHAAGLGNQHDLVGRYLTDHPVAELGRFNAADAARIERHFGFISLRTGGRSHMYSQGLALSPELQRAESLPNGAVFFMEDRAPDDPISALSRLLGGRSRNRRSDLASIVQSPGPILRGIGLKLMQSDRFPDALRRRVADLAVRLAPNTVASTFRYRGVPHKLTGARFEGITEQFPDPANRVRLSTRRDALGVPLPLVRWQVGLPERRALMRQGHLVQAAFTDAGLPVPALSGWIKHATPEAAQLTDLGHPMGTTRMSDTPTQGVVNADARLHDVAGLYVAGGSVMPTSGHANPTLMMLALTIRLADHLKGGLFRG